MPKTEAFDAWSGDYDEWFAQNPEIHARELRAVKSLLPEGGEGLEVGVGSGRFAGPLGVNTGVEPSEAMAARARAAGIRVARGVAENLPVMDGRFDFVLMVTVICFVDDLERTFAEARRVLRPGGSLVVAFIDRESELGRIYEQKKENDRFYRLARFYSAAEVGEALERAGFADLAARQTIFPAGDTRDVAEGSGEGSFVVLRGLKR